MTNENRPRESDAVLQSDDAPAHRAGFWADLEHTMTAELHGSATTTPAATIPATPTSSPTGDNTVGTRTEQLPTVSSRGDELAARRDRRRIWPIAAAAAVLALVGLGFLVTRGPTVTGTTDLVAGPTVTSDPVPLQGPEGAAGDGTDESPEGTGAVAGQDGDTDADGSGNSGDPETGETSDDSATVDPTPAVALLDSFEIGLGAEGEPDFFPLDGGLGSTATFLNNWPDAALTWWATTDEDGTCNNTSEIWYVNGSEFTQAIYDPQLGFSGDVTHFTVAADQRLAAWVVGSCDRQLELYVGSLQPDGSLADVSLVWFGQGSTATMLLQWTRDRVSMGSINPDGRPFSIEYSVGNDELTRNGELTLLEREEGAPLDRATTPAAASTDANFSYWPGLTSVGEGACQGSFGRADTLWLRSVSEDEGSIWQPALATEQLLGAVTAVAIEPEFDQVAFADSCPGQAGRFFLATQRADGTLSNLREVDLSPFVPGFASELHWIDSQTLRILTDNSELDIDPIRFDFRLDDGRENGVIVRLD